MSQDNEYIYTTEDVVRMFKSFYEKIKHGDEEHQKWLLDETLNFIDNELGKKGY